MATEVSDFHGGFSDYLDIDLGPSALYERATEKKLKLLKPRKNIDY